MNWTVLLSRGVLAGLALLASACTSSQISLDYQPSLAQVVPGSPHFAVGPFADTRGVSPYYLGKVSTPIGSPLEYIQTGTPANVIVRNAFSHALSARGMLTGPGRARFHITGEVLDLYCQQVVRPYGYARLRVNIVRAGTGQIVFSRVYAGERQSTAYMPGSGSPVPMLRDLTSRALQDAVDRALDDPEMRGRIHPSNAPYQPGML